MEQQQKAAHTPGPWTMDPEGELAISIEDADGSVVCDVHGAARGSSAISDPLCIANTRLITAAPKLLAALEAIRARLQECAVSGKNPTHRDLNDFNRWADAAIAEARGRS